MLSGKNAVITGSNRGIGKAIVEEFARQGCNIWACARKKNETFEEELSALAQKYGVWIKPVYFDLCSEEAIKNGYMEIRNDKQPIDILVNNAGIGHSGLFQMTSMQTVRSVFEVDVFSVMYFTQLVLKSMIRAKHGSIVNMASIAALDGSAMDCTYGAAKAALVAFTRSLCAEVGKAGVRVNAIAPGPASTDMLDMYSADTQELLSSRNPLGRLANPEEIASVAAFLASDTLSSYVNGQIVRVDGGFH